MLPTVGTEVLVWTHEWETYVVVDTRPGAFAIDLGLEALNHGEPWLAWIDIDTYPLRWRYPVTPPTEPAEKKD